jgi:hypothetical protein
MQICFRILLFPFYGYFLLLLHNCHLSSTLQTIVCKVDADANPFRILQRYIYILVYTYILALATSNFLFFQLIQNEQKISSHYRQKSELKTPLVALKISSHSNPYKILWSRPYQ